jgi:tripartite-type tricarboxylate transporter receptor subunit TctC
VVPAHPKQATYASLGTGSPLHFTGVQLARAAGIEYVHVPYQGAAPALQDLLGGQVASGILPVDTPLPYITSGTLRALATSRPKRGFILPDVPTFGEAGYPALETVDWWGVFVPARTPDEQVGALANSIRDAVGTSEVREGLAKLSVEIDVISRGDFARLLRSEFARWRSVVATSGFSPQD